MDKNAATCISNNSVTRVHTASGGAVKSDQQLTDLLHKPIIR